MGEDEHSLTVRGESAHGKEVYKVDRQVRLPSAIDLDSVHCTHINGMLTITLKRKASKRIPVSVGVEVEQQVTRADPDQAEEAASGVPPTTSTSSSKRVRAMS